MIIEDRPYQARAEQALVHCRAGIVKAPPRSGKTIIGARALKRWAVPRARLSRQKMRVTVVPFTIDQVKQWRDALAKFPEIEQSCVVTLACYQSGISLLSQHLVIFDECHHIAAPEFRKLLDGYAGWRWGFSATPKREDLFAGDVFELIGPIVCEIESVELLERGYLARARVTIHEPNQKDECVEAVDLLREEYEKRWLFGLKDAAFKLGEQPICVVAATRGVVGVGWVAGMAARAGLPMQAPLVSLFQRFGERRRRLKRRLWELCKAVAEHEIRSRAKWIAAQQVGVFRNPERNALIVDLVRRHEGESVLTIVAKIEHGQELAAQVPGAVVIHSQMRKRDTGMTRAGALDAFKAGTLKVVFATSLADEGLDVPRASVLILAGSGRSSVKTEQRSARVLTAFHDKTHGTIHDFMDVQHPFLHSQSKRRIETYRKLGYDIQFAQQGGLV